MSWNIKENIYIKALLSKLTCEFKDRQCLAVLEKHLKNTTCVITYAKSYINKLSLQYFTHSLDEYFCFICKAVLQIFFKETSCFMNPLRRHIYISYLQIFPIGKKDHKKIPCTRYKYKTLHKKKKPEESQDAPFRQRAWLLVNTC